MAEIFLISSLVPKRTLSSWNLRRQISIQMAYSNFAVIYATRTCFVSLETGPSSGYSSANVLMRD